MVKRAQAFLERNGLTTLPVVLLTFLLSLAGCNQPSVLPTAPGSGSAVAPRQPVAPTSASASNIQSKENLQPPARKNLAIVKVFYATDRSRTSQSEPAKLFGNKRGSLSYGSCEVAVPRDPKMAKLEEASTLRMELSDLADKQPSLRKVSPRGYDTYLDNLRSVIAKSSKKSAFVFVPGYNVTFADAARRTAQLKYDLGFDGAPIFFSWPSKGRADAYAADELDVEWAQPDLKEFLKDVAAKTKARNIYLIAHSMGNRALTKAYIYLISERPELKKLFREVILVAPDLDADLFQRDIAPALAAAANRTTIYSSSRDLTLKASNKYQNYQRVGDSGSNLVVYDGIETIDASNVDTGLGRHTQLAGNTSVTSDLYYLIREGKSPGERSGLKAVNAVAGHYWRFKTSKALPSQPALE
jgi:esterase/lipase superfamily enzyme